MSQILVTIGGLLAAAFVLWYFLGPRPKAAAVASAGGALQEVNLLVDGGYSPDTIVLRPGVATRLSIRREDEGECSEEFLIPDFGVRVFLPSHETTEVRFTPEKEGEFQITCGMGMLHGRVVVKGERGARAV
jgi:plastocyanin domain-containing protein